MQDISLPDVTFILVRPNYLGNIGSVARVLKNFGFERLRLVAPPRNYKDAEARKMAVGAFDILKKSEVYGSLGEALADISLAVGTTCAQQRDIVPLPLEEVIPKIRAAAGNKIAFVFGDERDGLKREELQRCHQVAMVRTVAEFPSLNVSQAVGIFAYELAKLTAAAPQPEVPLTTGAEDDELFNQITGLLDQVGFIRKYNREKINAELRSLYQRSHPTTRELDLLKGAIHKIDQKLRSDVVES
ncbi:MAG TPA: TrmJ/YjtD family RNA methyltransferase [Candidatus Obscuribacterales bacterium]